MGEVTVTRSGREEKFQAVLNVYPNLVDGRGSADLLLRWAIARPDPPFLVRPFLMRPSEISVVVRDGETATAVSDSSGKWTYSDSNKNNWTLLVRPWNDDAEVHVIN